LRKRHAIGKVTLDIYEEFSEEMKVRKKKLLEEFEKLDQKLSNPKELIHFTTKLTANLAPVWDSGDYYEKQIFQNTIFPAGLGYDSKIEHYRTPEVNRVIALIADLSKDLGEIKKPDFSNIEEKSGDVPPSEPNVNQILEDTRALAQIWDLYGHLVNEASNVL